MGTGTVTSAGPLDTHTVTSAGPLDTHTGDQRWPTGHTHGDQRGPTNPPLQFTDGFRDVARLFGEDDDGLGDGGGGAATTGLLSPHGAILAVTVVSQVSSSREAQQSRLEGALREGGARLGRPVVFVGETQAGDRPLGCLFYAVGVRKGSISREIEVPEGFVWHLRGL